MIILLLTKLDYHFRGYAKYFQIRNFGFIMANGEKMPIILVSVRK